MPGSAFANQDRRLSSLIDVVRLLMLLMLKGGDFHQASFLPAAAGLLRRILRITRRVVAQKP
jgi:hypothetical protein